jgi:hypothetical protein
VTHPSPHFAASRWGRGAAFGLLAIGVYLLLGQLHFFYQFHPHVPVKDTWRFLGLVETVLENGWGAVPGGDWVAAHAGAHRIVLTRLLMALDYQFLGGQNHLLFASAWLSLLALVGIYARVFHDLFPTSPGRFLFYLGLTLACLFSPSQLFNLVNPINASWYVAMAMSAASIYLLLTGGKRIAPGRLLLALSAAGMSALSNFSGLLVWLLLPFAVMLARQSRVLVASVAALAVLLVLTYLSGIESTVGIIINDPDVNSAARKAWVEQGQVLFWLRFCLGVFRNALLYLGAPLSTLSATGGITLASLSLVLLGFAWWWHFRSFASNAAPAPLPAFFLLVASLCIGIALATQLGRIYIGGPDALRYQTVVMVYWLNICGLLATFPWRLLFRSKAFVSGGQASPVLCLLLMVSLVFLPLGKIGSRESEFINEAVLAEQLGRLGVFAAELYRGAYPGRIEDPQPQAAPLFNRRGLAYMAGSNLPEEKPAAEPDACAPGTRLALGGGGGVLQKVTLEWGGSSGWLYRRIAVVRDGQPAGFIVPQLPEHASAVDFLPGRERNWIGYMHAVPHGGGVVTLYIQSSIAGTNACTVQAGPPL